ncbi:MAG: HEAT repeat domain-containing protein, partial [Deltaproteobacteria bacterium]|nr:HEAT repeat domain-containing protein [Deltaproteobacteria bacterium]
LPLRLLAIEAAGKLKLPATAPALQKAWEAELRAIEAAREDWVKAPPTGGAAPEAEADRTRDLLARVSALNAQKLKDLGRRGTRRLAPAELAEDLGGEEARTATALLEALARVGAPGARELLERWTQDPLPLLRRSAYVGLASLGGDALQSAREGLFDPDREVQLETARALVRAGEAGQVQVVQAAVELAGDRVSLLTALLEADQSLPPAAVAPLVGLLAEGGPDAALAARLLGEARAVDAVKPLLNYLDDTAAMGRREALVALGRMGDASVAGAVARDLCHESPELRAAALEVLAALAQAHGGKAKGDLSAHAAAVDALKGDYHARVRELAAAAEKALK